MSTEILKKEDTSVATFEEDGGEDILASNIVIPKVLLMQGLSELVADGKARMGDMVRSTTGEKLGDDEVPIEFIPLTFNTTWIIQERVGGSWEWRGQEPLVASNSDLPWEFEQNGTQWKRTKALNLYALLVKDVEAEKAELDKVAKGQTPNPDKALLPVLISFRSLSFQAGKDVTTHFAKAKRFGLKGYVSVLALKCYKEKNDKGTFYLFQVSPTGKSTPKETLTVCETWRNMVTSNRVQVDNSDEVEPEGKGAPAPDSQF